MDFVVIGYDENYLRSVSDFFSLHPDVSWHGSVFSRTDFDQESSIKVGEDPIEYLQSIHHKDKTTGFSLHKDHARDASWCKVWRYCRNIKVVISCGNPLESYLTRFQGSIFLEKKSVQRYLHEIRQLEQEWQKDYPDAFLLKPGDFKNLCDFLGISQKEGNFHETSSREVIVENWKEIEEVI